MTAAPQVLILGAGFAGMAAAQALKDAPVEVTLVDKNDFHTFHPLLYQIATLELSPSEVGFPVREQMHRQSNLLFHQTTVTGIDLANKQVQVERMAPLTYDYLVLALGAQVNFLRADGADQNGFPMYTMHDAIRIKDHILEVFEATDKDPSLIDDGALTFAIVGGGATGVETSGALSELFHVELNKDYPNLPVQKARIILFNHGPDLLGPFNPKLRSYVRKQLELRGVEVRTGEGVAAVGPDYVKLSSGEVVKARTVIWAAGVQANSLAKSLGLPTGKGGTIPVNLDLTLEGHPEVYIVGDIAAMTDAKTNKLLPQLGSTAMQAGKQAGENIAHAVKGEPTQPFKYVDKGTMATVGRGAAIVELPGGHTMTGHSAWLAWLSIHLVLLSGGESKTNTTVDWGWTLLTKKRGKRIVFSDEDIAAEQAAQSQG
jgi:NADH dehydrogenase